MAMPPLPDPLVPQVYRVEQVRRELSDTVTLELSPRSGSRPTFEAGQFNMLYAFGVGEVPNQHEWRPRERGRLCSHCPRCRRRKRSNRKA